MSSFKISNNQVSEALNHILTDFSPFSTSLTGPTGISGNTGPTGIVITNG